MSETHGVAAEVIEKDFLIVGTGGGGLLAAMKAKEAGLDALVVEKTEYIGGSTAMSGGVVWAPANEYLLAEGYHDTLERGLAYLDAVVGDAGPATTRERKVAYLEGNLRMLDFLKSQGVRLRYSASPDDYPDAPFGMVQGRALEATIIHKDEIGAWEPYLRPSPLAMPIALQTDDSATAVLAFRNPKNFARMVKLIGRDVKAKARKRKLLTLGQALVGQILIVMQQRGIDVWRETPMRDLLIEDGRVVGAVVERDGRRIEVRTRHGVLLAAGGFARNKELREEYQPDPIDGGWTVANPGDEGDALRAGLGIGAATSNLDEAIWLPAPLLDGTPMLGIWERSLPHSIIVDGDGQRYMNESGPYMEAGQHMLRRNLETGKALPSWLIFDSRHRKRYPFVTAPPAQTPKAWLESGFLKKADTLEELAAMCGIDATGLRATVERFNGFARNGKDEDFHRGETRYDRYFGDPNNKGSNNLGTIEKGPFYAVGQIVTDVSTVGGLVTDTRARVLREDGSIIEGLYASGCSAASVHGRIYPAPGASISHSMTFGYIAAEDVIERRGAAA
ncbi:unannotated protein [freshwater metagenome]|uniref:Unannotated protein n=1 Tax=freshwater metagenome TaxID=449393 RepID=A0A6J7J598_9ZZZZ|nr:FAD-dependent oxidoreductase [Actinomycetota bacterium]